MKDWRERNTKIKSLSLSREIFCGLAASRSTKTKMKIIKPQLKDAEIETMAIALVFLLFAVSENSFLCPVLRYRSFFFALLASFITAILAFCSVLIDLSFPPLAVAHASNLCQRNSRSFSRSTAPLMGRE